jgi:catechol 2,3-dioxygenase-like lactoylglutathione lyase family enzyme
VGEHGEVVVYLTGPGGAVGVREAGSAGAVDRYAPGLHHLAFDAPSREVVDAVAAWLREEGAEIEGGPGERDYTPATTRCSSSTRTASSSRSSTSPRGRARPA